MPPWDEAAENRNAVAGQRLAVVAEAFYVANLLVLPVLGFIVLLILYFRQHKNAPALARSHLEQTLSACIAMLLIGLLGSAGMGLLILYGVSAANIWIIGVIAFTSIHTTMVLLGILGLARAMAGKCWRYPLVGRQLPADCPGG